MNALLKILADDNAWGSFWMPPQGSTNAASVDWLFFFIYWICVFFFLLILVLLVGFAWKYRYREGQPMLDAPKHNTALELTWTFIPTLIVIVIFFYGFKGYLALAVPPPDSYEVDVTARMWSYTFRYPNGEQSGELHIPINTPVVFVLSSDDVLHGFYMPIFRIKKDVVPGRYNKIWVQATMLGTFDVYCTQYCGQDHSSMRNHVVVQTRDDFVKWLDKLGGADLPPVERGQLLWQTRGCQQCHSTNGDATGKAPTWKDLFGSQVSALDGKTYLADEDYLHTVITQPNIHPLPGFNPIMPPTDGLLTAKDVNDVIAYIKSISKYYHPVKLSGSGPATKPTGGAAKP